MIIDDKSRGKPRRKTLQQIEVVFPIIAGKVKGIAESPETAAPSGGGRLFTVGIVWCGHLQRRRVILYLKIKTLK